LSAIEIRATLSHSARATAHIATRAVCNRRESGKGAVGEKIMNVEISGAFWITVILEAAITSLEMANHIAALEAALIAKDLIAKNPQQDRPLMVLFEEAMAAQGSKNRERLDVLRHMLEELRSRNPQPVPPAAPPVN
jgi:hypothetical protein